MTGFLLDVNTLIAFMWPAHEAHKRVHSWFHLNSSSGWATCAFTQAAFVRIVSNPAFSPDAVEPQEAIHLLQTNTMHADHQFWGNDVSFLKAVGPFAKKLKGHKQVTDAYLLGLALHKKGRLVSLDRGILQLLADKTMEGGLLVLL